MIVVIASLVYRECVNISLRALPRRQPRVPVVCQNFSWRLVHCCVLVICSAKFDGAYFAPVFFLPAGWDAASSRRLPFAFQSEAFGVIFFCRPSASTRSLWSSC